MTSVPRNSTCSQERTSGASRYETLVTSATGHASAGRRAPTLRRVWPDVVAHADWSVDRRKRWACVARRRGDRYAVEAIEPVADLAALVGLTAPAESVVIGVDAPIGLPVAYARAAGHRSVPALAPGADGAGTRAVVSRRGDPGRHRRGPTLLPAAPGRGASCPPGGGSRPVVVRRPPPRLRPLAAVGPSRGFAVLDDGRQPGRQGRGGAVGRSRQRPGGAGVALRRRPRGSGRRRRDDPRRGLPGRLRRAPGGGVEPG